MTSYKWRYKNYDKKEAYESSDDLREIICFNLIQIGELTICLDDSFVNQYSDVPWSKIRAMRNRIIHSYGTIDNGRIWLTANEDISPLTKYSEQILSEK